MSPLQQPTDRRRELDVEEMKTLIDELVDLGYDGIILTGGEPTLSLCFFRPWSMRHSVVCSTA